MRILIILCFTAFSILGFSQDPILQKNNESLETIATSITDKYDDELALDAKQFILFQRKVEEFLIREEKIHATYEGEEKLDRLYKLRKAESLEMRNILTKPQFSLYKQLKPQLQPIAVLDSKKS
ncbi:hypothetical protein BWZ20_01715 [Winogradskyella sp. J14-2]|uniref:hypothetical protein n=1 Tax=Winogradskyella sp. J14-2 TaxID=1936080 RepID=UPI0009726ADB|nr:hypothetical protein [Winogradskyella sp. J14-2]APY07096.1 hypothetical protein BWZ20_01715 [Winogradskyella sp. J14-2]